MDGTYKVMNNPANQTIDDSVGVYECEIRLKFRLIEEKLAMRDPEQLLQMLVDAFAYGSDEYMESLDTDVVVHEVAELDASPNLRRQLIRLRNAS